MNNMYSIPMEILPVQIEKIFYIEVTCGDEINIGDIGNGEMNIYPITGGYFEGEKLRGSVMNFGADWNYMQHSNGIDIISTKYLLKTDDGAFISLSTRGICIESQEQIEMEMKGEFIDPETYYFRQHLFFETGADKYQWLNGIIAFAIVGFKPTGEICYNAYMVK
jgi:hypothetical protein